MKTIFLVICTVQYEGSYTVAAFEDETDAQLKAHQLNESCEWFEDYSIKEIELL